MSPENAHPDRPETVHADSVHQLRLQHIAGILPLIFVAGNLCFWLLPVVILSAFKAVIPVRRVRAAIYWLLVWIYALAVRCDNFLFFSLFRIELDVSGLEDILPTRSYVVIANHQSWSDIFILQRLMTRPPAAVKFLVKRELKFLPVIGLICWAYDYPFLRRRSKRLLQGHPQKNDEDIQTIRKAMERMGRSPASIVNLVEGTRFSAAKARARKSPYDHLLLPRAGGLVYILRSMGDRLEGVINLTIVYDCPKPVFWNFMSGICRRVVVRAERRSVSDILGFEPAGRTAAGAEAVASWLNTAWKEKDKQIGAIKRDLKLNA